MYKINLILLFLFIFVSSAFGVDVVWEDNFDTYSSNWNGSEMFHSVYGGTLEDPGHKQPTNWTGYIRQHTDAKVEVRSDSGRVGYGARIAPNYGGGDTFEQLGLVKYLEGPTGYGSGYSEIYIRWYMKYSDDYAFGLDSEASYTYVKWLRIWQDVQPIEVRGDDGHDLDEEGLPSNNSYRGYILWTISADAAAGDFQPFFKATMSVDGVTDSATAPRIKCWHTTGDVSEDDGGYLEGNFGAINETTRKFVDTPTWHRIEVRIKLATNQTPANGIMTTWVDGIEQVDWDDYVHDGSTGVTGPDALPTLKLGGGINYIGFHDNGTGSGDWSSQQYVYIDDVVVSTTYIGDYIQGDEESNTTIQGVTLTPGVNIN